MSGVRALLTAALIPLILFTAGCQTVTGRSFGQYVGDGVTKAKVKSNLVTAKASNLTRVGVDVKNRICTESSIRRRTRRRPGRSRPARRASGAW